MTAEPSLNPSLAKEHWLNRLRYRSWHRGCKETDLILGHYCDKYITTLSDAELSRFETFLDEDDGDIWSWLTESKPCPKPEYEPLLSVLRGVVVQP